MNDKTFIVSICLDGNFNALHEIEGVSTKTEAVRAALHKEAELWESDRPNNTGTIEIVAVQEKKQQ